MSEYRRLIGEEILQLLVTRYPDNTKIPDSDFAYHASDKSQYHVETRREHGKREVNVYIRRRDLVETNGQKHVELTPFWNFTISKSWR